LAGKQGFGTGKKAFYFALYHVFTEFYLCMSLSVKLLQMPEVSQKNHAKKPTVGFSLFGGCGTITP